MTTVITRGAGSAQALGYAARATAANYIEDVFSTYLYTGNGSTQTITNNIDLSTKGGMVWLKSRSAATNNFLFDTSRSALNELNSNTTDAQASLAASLTAFNTTGFSLGAAAGINVSAATYASWTFRKQAKFFDVVTYTGNGANRTISHNLGSVPGCIMVKRTDTTGDWQCYHRSLANTQYMVLNTTAAVATGATRWNSTTPTDTVFSLGTEARVNASGGTYVAYLFAHNAGGFGASGADNVISCGTYLGNQNGVDVDLGYEPQFLLIKSSDTVTENWVIVDNMRGLPVGGNANILSPNVADAEAATSSPPITLTATGFKVTGTDYRFNYNLDGDAAYYIYIAIRRGPMRTPTSGTSVYYGEWVQDVNNIITPNFPVDLAIDRYAYENDSQVAQTGSFYVYDRLRGSPANLVTNTTAAETTTQPSFFVTTTGFQSNTKLGIGPGDGSLGNWYANFWAFRRAPGFFDEVCYTGTGANTTQAHNLTAIPELIIVKKRSATGAWQVYSSALANTQYMVLNTTAAVATGATRWNSTTPTSSVFSIGTDTTVNASAATYVAYLFATVAGVSKVGSYTGSGTTKQIDCGFTGGARFVLIKRTDSTGDWYVWDSARGIVAGNDPYLLLNSTAAEVTNTDYIDTYSAGFEISSTAPAAINANGGTFIFLAIA